MADNGGFVYMLDLEPYQLSGMDGHVLQGAFKWFAAEIERLQSDNDRLDRLATDWGAVIDAWHEKTGCSHPEAVKRKIERLRSALQALYDYHDAPAVHTAEYDAAVVEVIGILKEVSDG
jgi:hypothetical protein